MTERRSRLIYGMSMAGALALAWLLAGPGMTPAEGQMCPMATELSPADEAVQSCLSSFVLVDFYFKRSDKASPSSMYSYDEDEDLDDDELSQYQSYIEAKRPLRLVGVVIEPELALIVDSPLNPDYIDRIEVRALTGGKSPGHRRALLKSAPGLLIEFDQPASLNVQPVKFEAAPEEFEKCGPLYEVKLQSLGVDFALGVDQARPMTVIDDQGGITQGLLTHAEAGAPRCGLLAGFPYLMVSSTDIGAAPTLLLNAEKKPVGVALHSRLPFEPGKAPVWRGAEVLADARYDIADWDAMADAIKAKFDKVLLQAKFTFRQNLEEEESGYGNDYSYTMSRLLDEESGERPTEKYYFGVPVSDSLFFIPQRISRGLAKVIDTIKVEVDGQEKEGRFLGAFDDIGGFLVKFEVGALPYDEQIYSNAGLPMINPVAVVSASRKFGGRYLRVAYNRATDRVRGYKDEEMPAFVDSIPTGALLAGLDGGVFAMNLEQRLEDEDKDRFRNAETSYYGMSLGDTKCYELSALLEHFTAPEPHFDKTIVWLSKDQEKRKMWLGVEFDPLTKDLSESLGVEKLTKDGKIGLIVSTVYAGSPAERIGLQEGDILLSLTEEDDPQPIELAAEERYDYSDYYGDADLPPELEAMGYDYPRPPAWKPRSNLLTKLLEVIGAGATVNLNYLAGGKTPTTKSFTVEQAPPDYESAPKFKDREVGLTVKELTYEVRHALRLPADLTGVVVSQVEEGSSAAIARIAPHDLILRIDDAEIADVAVFESIIKAAKERVEQGESVSLRVTLQQMDKTRLADMHLQKTD